MVDIQNQGDDPNYRTSQGAQGPTNQVIWYGLRNLFNALINGDRGYQAPWPLERAGTSREAAASIDAGGPHILARDPAAALVIKVVPQAFDWVHAVQVSRMLPAFSLESTSGGWVALSYAFDPPPDIPAIVLPQAQWAPFGGETVLTGLTTKPAPFGAIASFPGTPAPGFAYPAIISSPDNVTTTNTL